MINLSSDKELGKFDQIILTQDGIDLNSLKKNIDYNIKKILVLIISGRISDEVLSIENDKISVKLFSWSLFNEEHYLRWYSHKLSINNSDEVFEILYKKNRYLINFFKKLYSSNDVLLAFKKAVANKLNDYYEMISIYELLKKHHNNILPIVNKKSYESINSLLQKNSNKDIKSDFHQVVKYFTNKFLIKNFLTNNLIFIFYPIFSILSIKKFKINKDKKKIGIRVYKDGIGVDDNYKLDWILDNNLFKKKESIFLVEDSGNKRIINGLKLNNFNYLNCSNRIPLERCSLIFFLKIIFLYFPLGLFFFPIFFLSHQILKEESIIAWIKFFIWKNFILTHNLKSYLCYHNYSSDHVYRNILLKKNNCYTIMYKHTHSENVFDYNNREKYANTSFMNLYYDTEFHWSKAGIEMAKLNKSKSKEFLISGPVWTSKELIKPDNQLNTNNKKFVVSFFSTSFSGLNAVNSIESHKKFLQLALEIAKDNSDFFIIFKPKNDFELYRKHNKIKELVEKLVDCENFIAVDSNYFSPKIFTTSDIVISMSFASTGLEAMCLGKRSFYVDLLNTYKNSYFDNFEKIVSHSNEDALNNLNYWMSLDKNKVSSKHEEIFKEMGISHLGKASEIIRNQIIKRTNN